MAGLIGVFGGTFDPPHLGHLILAAEACEQLRLERLLWVLTPDPPHKRGRAISPLEQRIAMLKLAIAGEPCFEISRVDMERPAPHYAVDTVRLLRAAYPVSELAYLVGGDSLAYLPSWYRPAKLVAAVDILGVMRRPGAEIDLSSLEAQVPGLTARVRWIDAPLLEISSSDIRQRICQLQTFRYFLPPPVYEFIQLNKLYGSSQ